VGSTKVCHFFGSKTEVPAPLAPQKPLSHSVSVNYIHGSCRRQPNHLDSGGHYHYVYYTRRQAPTPRQQAYTGKNYGNKSQIGNM